MTVRFLEKNYIPFMLAVVAVLAGISAWQQISDWWITRNAPMEWKSVEVLNPIVHAGDDLSLVYTARINRTCPAELRGFLIFEDNSSPVRFPVVAGGYRQPSDGFISFAVHITIPKTADPGIGSLLPGKYIYRAIVTRYCQEGSIQDNGIPDAKFQLIN